ncbi:MAG: XisI protein [Kastovskya adunca ATA6-11-RM4]|jgi:hypothetical protein|nr:XisI protein [Kastovskya adunca ATA6-11-RM4]
MDKVAQYRQYIQTLLSRYAQADVSGDRLTIIFGVVIQFPGDERSLKIPLFKQFGNRHGKTWHDFFTI